MVNTVFTNIIILKNLIEFVSSQIFILSRVLLYLDSEGQSLKSKTQKRKKQVCMINLLI